MNLKELLKGIDVPEDNESMHRCDKKERPVTEVELKACSDESMHWKRSTLDPTPDLVALPKNNWDECCEMVSDWAGFIVTCADTEQTWFAPTEECLNKNFIYREDLTITEVKSHTEALDVYKAFNDNLNAGVHCSTVCYILDNPPKEAYEVYYDSAYPSLHYGKATPMGCVVHRYANRFHRDMAILSLDDLYANSSEKLAKKLTAKALTPKQAIVISDGAWMREVSSSCTVYIDDSSLIKMTEARVPSDKDQAVLLSEIRGATNALQLCMAHHKKDIVYYYDNTSILNVFRNKKTEYLEEVRVYKELLADMDSKGYKVTFTEVHPKTSETKDTDNKAIQFFHNTCDNECRTISTLYDRHTIDSAVANDFDGKSYGDVRNSFKGAKRNPNNNYRKRL